MLVSSCCVMLRQSPPKHWEINWLEFIMHSYLKCTQCKILAKHLLLGFNKILKKLSLLLF